MMPDNAILSALLAELDGNDAPAYVQWHKAQEWPVEALNRLLKERVLTSATAAQSIECQACEYHCYKDLIFQSDIGRDRAFIICEEPEMQAQMGRMSVPVAHLQQWKITIKQVASVVARLLGLDEKVEYKSGQSVIRLGMLPGEHGRRWASFIVGSLTLEVNGYEMQIQELLYFEKGQLMIDRARIDEYLNSPDRKHSKPYLPSIDKREASKLKTQAMHQDWRGEYSKKLERHPTKGDVWISKQIAKMNIAQGRDAETIRRNMKL